MEFPVMAHAESNRSPAPTSDTETAAPARTTYRIPTLRKLDLRATERAVGTGAGGDFTGSGDLN